MKKKETCKTKCELKSSNKQQRNIRFEFDKFPLKFRKFGRAERRIINIIINVFNQISVQLVRNF